MISRKANSNTFKFNVCSAKSHSNIFVVNSKSGEKDTMNSNFEKTKSGIWLLYSLPLNQTARQPESGITVVRISIIYHFSVLSQTGRYNESQPFAFICPSPSLSPSEVSMCQYLSFRIEFAFMKCTSHFCSSNAIAWLECCKWAFIRWKRITANEWIARDG